MNRLPIEPHLHEPIKQNVSTFLISTTDLPSEPHGAVGKGAVLNALSTHAALRDLLSHTSPQDREAVRVDKVLRDPGSVHLFVTHYNKRKVGFTLIC